METKIGPLTFFSNFDSGNLARVERVKREPNELNNTTQSLQNAVVSSSVEANKSTTTLNTLPLTSPTPDFEYKLWTSPDCAGTVYENGNRTWFYFGVRGCQAGKLVKFNIMNMNKQGRLYNQGMCPLFKILPGRNNWERIRDKPSWEVVDGHFQLSFLFRFPEHKSAVSYFAFCYPFSYEETQLYLRELDAKFRSKTTNNTTSIYYHRELICKSIDELRVDLITVSSMRGCLEKQEPRLTGLFPDLLTKRAKQFKEKKVFILTSRVHPGETPSSYVFKGFLDFITRIDDPRAAALRDRYVFKLIPLLNPDGVKRGHYRTDQRGVNLNRVYLNPDSKLHPSIYAAKSLIAYHYNGELSLRDIAEEQNLSLSPLSNKVSSSQNISQEQLTQKKSSVAKQGFFSSSSVAVIGKNCEVTNEHNTLSNGEMPIQHNLGKACVFKTCDSTTPNEASANVVTQVSARQDYECEGRGETISEGSDSAGDNSSTGQEKCHNFERRPSIEQSSCKNNPHLTADDHIMVSDQTKKHDLDESNVGSATGNSSISEDKFSSSNGCSQLSSDKKNESGLSGEGHSVGYLEDASEKASSKTETTSPVHKDTNNELSSQNHTKTNDGESLHAKTTSQTTTTNSELSPSNSSRKNAQSTGQAQNNDSRIDGTIVDSKLAFYVDLHGHASKRGCFMYGNYFEDDEKYVQSMLFPKVISVNSSHFDFTACNFTEKNMYSKDKRDGMSKEGSGRVTAYKITGLPHCYTLECNYNCGRSTNAVPPATCDAGRATPPPPPGFPPRFTPEIYEEVGRAVAISALDMMNANPWSRLPKSEYSCLEGVKNWVYRYLRSAKDTSALTAKKSHRVVAKIISNTTTSCPPIHRTVVSKVDALPTGVNDPGIGSKTQDRTLSVPKQWSSFRNSPDKKSMQINPNIKDQGRKRLDMAKTTPVLLIANEDCSPYYIKSDQLINGRTCFSDPFKLYLERQKSIRKRKENTKVQDAVVNRNLDRKVPGSLRNTTKSTTLADMKTECSSAQIAEKEICNKANTNSQAILPRRRSSKQKPRKYHGSGTLMRIGKDSRKVSSDAIGVTSIPRTDVTFSKPSQVSW